MSRSATKSRKGHLAAAAIGVGLVVGVPSASLAFSLISDGAAAGHFVSFTPASADPEMARLIETRGSVVRLQRFTPAGATRSDDQSVTVAVRVGTSSAQAITVNSMAANGSAEPTVAALPRIAASRYNLGVARGYRSFAQAPAVASRAASQTSVPVASDFDLAASNGDDEPNRFAARIALEQESRPAPVAPRSIDSVVDQRLDVAGSYRLSRNLDVTAGVRYEQERNRLAALPNVEQQDSQAVYIGTQFRF